MRIFLIGFMGTGKTKVGKQLSRKLKMGFIDIDNEIENKTKKTITDIFKTDGEKKFRRYETEILKKVCNKNNIVVSTGGGIIISSKNRKSMKDSGVVIGLFASPEQILNRIEKETHRPLVAVKNKLDRIKNLLNKRNKYYKNTSDYMVNTDNLSIKEIIDSIISFLKY